MKYIPVLILLLMACWVRAQTSFLAYQVSGTVTFKENNKQFPLKTGKVLPVPGTVSVEKDGPLVLVCNSSSHAITLQQGTYELDKLTSRCNEKDDAAITKYLQYVWWQFTTPHPSPDEERKKMMADGGAVFRGGCPGIEFSSIYDTLCYYKENIVLQWNITGNYAKKVLVLYDYQNSSGPVLSLEPGRNSYSLDSIKDKLQASREYVWGLRLDDEEPCMSKLLQVWGKADFDKFCDSIRTHFVIALDSAEKNYMMGYFLEINHFYGEAYRYYATALAAQPGNFRYQTTLTRCRSIAGKE